MKPTANGTCLLNEQDPTVKQAADFFQTTPKTIYQRIKDGTLESYVFGNMRRIKHESIEHVRAGSK